MYLTGFHAIEEYLKSGKSSGPLLVGKAGPRARELVKLAGANRVTINQVGTHELDRLAPEHRGIALEVQDSGGPDADFAGVTSVEAFLKELGEKKEALILILDEITDPHNYGAILRSCDQFGVDLVVSRRKRSAKNAAVIAQTSSGASAWVRNAEEANLIRAMDMLKEEGFWIYGADMDGSAVYGLDLRGRTALVMGGEAGLSRLLRERCDGIAAIPCGGRVGSLNVSVAAGLLLY